MLIKKILRKKELYWVILDKILSTSLIIIGIKLITTFVAKEEFAKLGLANTIIQLIASYLVFQPLGQSFLRYWSFAKGNNEIMQFISVYNRLRMVAILICLSLCTLFIGVSIYFYSYKYVMLIICSSLLGITIGSIGLRLSIYEAERMRKNVALINIFLNLSKPIIALSVILLINRTAEWILIGYIIPAIIIIIIAEYNFKRHFSIDRKALGEVNADLKSNIIKYASPLAIWSIFSWIHISVDIWAINYYLGSNVMAGYYLASRLSTFPIILLSTILTSFFIPIAYEKSNSTSDPNYKKSFIIISFCILIYCIGILFLESIYFFFHNEIMVAMSNDKYSSSSNLIPLLTLTWALFYLGQLITCYGYVLCKPEIYIFPKISSSILALLGVIYFTYKYGVFGPIIGLTIAGVNYCLTTILATIRSYRRPQYII